MVVAFARRIVNWFRQSSSQTLLKALNSRICKLFRVIHQIFEIHIQAKLHSGAKHADIRWNSHIRTKSWRQVGLKTELLDYEEVAAYELGRPLCPVSGVL